MRCVGEIFTKQRYSCDEKTKKIDPRTEIVKIFLSTRETQYFNFRLPIEVSVHIDIDNE